MKVLVTAASQHGSTAMIAEAIGDELRARGLDVTVAVPEEVGALADFDAVILGSAVYTGHWLKPATELAKRIGAELERQPVWLFSSGPVGDPSRKLVQQMGVDPADVSTLMATTRASEHRVFAGELERRRLRGPQRAALFVFRGLEGDFRDWSAIRAWADAIADKLLSVRAP
jgi:menaquinone-dependent protoporphyrinogen oxidase